MLRAAFVAMAGLCVVGAVSAGPAVAGDMGGEEARRFVIGKLFTYNCFEGTRGAGRVFSDGSVVGTIQFQGSGPVRRAFLPAGTLQVKEERVCAQMRGMMFQPCFSLTRLDNSSFRGAVSGLGFAYCDFRQGSSRPRVAEGGEEQTAPERPIRHSRPLALRPSLAEARN